MAENVRGRDRRVREHNHVGQIMKAISGLIKDLNAVKFDGDDDKADAA